MSLNCEPFMKLKVLIAAPLPPPDHGGIINWSNIIRKELGKDPSIEVKFVDTMPRFRSATNLSLGLRLVGGSVQAMRDTYRIYKQLKTFQPHLLHLCTTAGPASLKDILILRIAKKMLVPSITHYRMGRLPDIIARAGVEWKLTRRAMRLANVIIPLDWHSEKSVKTALPEAKVVKLPNMVDIDDIDRICQERLEPAFCPSGHIRLVFAGHIIPTKGLYELVTACTRLADCPLTVDLLGPGNADFQNELRQIAAQKHHGQWLRLLGPVSHEETVRHIAAADIFVLPTYTEGMPNVILEAMACRRAILSTTVGAVPEMLDIGGPQECGVCVQPKNVDEITNAIRRLANNPQERTRLGLVARQRAEQLYSVPISCGQLVSLWRSVAFA